MKDRTRDGRSASSARTRLGYLVPEFPNQTHIMFWREILEIEKLGVDLDLVSTRAPAAALQAHSWSDTARRRTSYLYPVPRSDVPPLLMFLLSNGPRVWSRAAQAVRCSERPLRERPHLVAAVVLGARLAMLARARGWNHLHVHSCAASADVACFARIFAGPGYSLTLHGPPGDYGPDQTVKWAGASFGIVITEQLRRELDQAVKSSLPPVRVCGMGAGMDRLTRSVPYAPWRGQGPATVFSVGRLNPSKGHRDLIDAVARMRADGVDVRCSIAGEDEAGGQGYRRELQALIDERGLRQDVQLLGAVDEDRVIAGLHESHVFALASLAEPLGVAVMEAMAAGIPTVATDAGGIPILVTDGVDGLLVPPSDPRALAVALRRVLTDPNLAESLGHAAERTTELRAKDPSSAQILVKLATAHQEDRSWHPSQ